MIVRPSLLSSVILAVFLAVIGRDKSAGLRFGEVTLTFCAGTVPASYICTTTKPKFTARLFRGL